MRVIENAKATKSNWPITSAVIQSTEETKVRARTTPLFRFTVRVTAPGGQGEYTTSLTQRMPASEAAHRFRPGTEVDVRYNPRLPTTLRLMTLRSERPASVQAIVDQETVQWRHDPATIENIEDMHAFRNGNPVLEFTIWVEPAGSAAYRTKAEQDIAIVDLAMTFKVGSRVIAKYDPARPLSVHLLPRDSSASRPSPELCFAPESADLCPDPSQEPDPVWES